MYKIRLYHVSDNFLWDTCIVKGYMESQPLSFFLSKTAALIANDAIMLRTLTQTAGTDLLSAGA